MPHRRTNFKSYYKHCTFFGGEKTFFLLHWGNLDGNTLTVMSVNDLWIYVNGLVQLKVCFTVQLWPMRKSMTRELHPDVVSKFIKALENLGRDKAIQSGYVRYFDIAIFL